MSQFDVLSLNFPTPPPGDRAELNVIIDNPEHYQLAEDPTHTVPNDVEIVSPGQTPTSEFWVLSDHFHLTITMEEGNGSNPFTVDNTGYYSTGETSKSLDIIVAEKGKDNKKKTRKVRRGIAIVFD